MSILTQSPGCTQEPVGESEADAAWVAEQEFLDDLHDSPSEAMVLTSGINRLRDEMLGQLPAGTEIVFDRHQVWGKQVGDSWGVLVTLPGMLVADAVTAHGLDVVLVAAAALTAAKNRWREIVAAAEVTIDVLSGYTAAHQARALDRLAAEVEKAGVARGR